MEFINELAQNRDIPLLAAFALGLLTAVSPCPLATNITATAYISKHLESKRMVLISGLLYVFGRAITYMTIGLIIYFGASAFEIASFTTQGGELILAPILILVGLVMLNVIPLKLPGGVDLTTLVTERLKLSGPLGALMIGVLFALAFCPYSGALYFGILIPMTVSSTSGLYLPIIFAIGTGLPVMVFAYLIAYSAKLVGRTFNMFQRIEKVMRIIAGSVFIITGLYYLYIYFG